MKEKFFPKSWSYNRQFNKGNKRIDKITLSVHGYYVNQKFQRSNMKSITVNKNGPYYYQIHIHSEHINPKNFVIQDIVHAISLLRKEGFFSRHYLETIKYNQDYQLLSILNVNEIEIAFDVPKRRVDFSKLKKTIFKKYLNSYYTEIRVVKLIKKSEFCLYNKSLKYLTENIIKEKCTDDIFRGEFRLGVYRICQINNSRCRSVLNCVFLCQKEDDLIRSLIPLLSRIRIDNKIPKDLFKNYHDQKELKSIMNGIDL